jgi:hypothetical protein
MRSRNVPTIAVIGQGKRLSKLRKCCRSPLHLRAAAYPLQKPRKQPRLSALKMGIPRIIG